MTTYDSICKQLDALTVSYFNKLNEYNHHWQDAADHFQQGFVDLAHAKYTMGARTLSQYSYDERMKAILQVDIDEQEQMHPKQVIQHTATKQLDDIDDDDKESIKLKEKKKKSTNPLHWFGLLVSPSLRLSQDHFKKGKHFLLYSKLNF
ncbi:uncharacterized protein B0P05DRAFT_558272 [Gilbertella persicaria]|uniref:uncharacterized protein n=1 Tax=Gilbertella persicaria TaxID=101096 RepID=UPI00221F0A2A|nr:uncharacterized protein B0P05DRAFT_558272 [Gilbertella persicaria]KAI8059982.1 hypothetical protein B0P05DRAFT_558272 [Gilbertella persicaria]